MYTELYDCADAWHIGRNCGGVANVGKMIKYCGTPGKAKAVLAGLVESGILKEQDGGRYVLTAVGVALKDAYERCVR